MDADLFRVGDINISDPDGSGTPLALPGVLEWERVDVNTGIMGVEVNAPGMVLNLAPRRPSRTWIRQFDAMPDRPNSRPGRHVPSPPTIAHLQRYGNASVLLSGPLRDRLGVVFAGSYSRATRLDRANPAELDSGYRLGVHAPGLHAVAARRSAVGILGAARDGAGRSSADLQRA